MDLDKNVFDECNLQKSAPLLCNETVRMFCCVVTRTGYRPPCKLGINLRYEKLNERVTCRWRASINETDNQQQKIRTKVRIFLLLVTRTGNRPPRKRGINPRHEKLNEKVACGLRASHTETKHQKEKHPN